MKRDYIALIVANPLKKENKMKKIAFIILLFMATLLFSNTGIEGDKGWHFTGCMALYIATDLVVEWLDLPFYVPIITVSCIAIGKELCDKRFNWQDINADALGLSVGILIRLGDKRR
jgi:hypothetical protein